MRAKLSVKELLELNLKPSVESTAVTYCTEFHAFFQYFMLTRRVTTRSLKITKEIPEIQHSRRPRYDSTEDFWLKGVRQIAFVQVARAEEAIAASTAGMDMVGTGFRPETRDFANLIPETHFQFGLAWGRHASAEEALREAMQAMEAGAETIYCGMSPQVVEVLAREGVPVIAQVGLVPPKATRVGGMRAVGRTSKQATEVFQACKAFEAAGAFALEMEVVPAQVAAEITRRVSILTISLGSGKDCDATYLFSADLLGENRGHIPRHAKVYRHFATERDRLQQERVAAYQEYIDDISGQRFPEAEHDVSIDETEFENFLNRISHQLS